MFEELKWNDTVSDPRLPKCNIFWIRWNGFWFRELRRRVCGRPGVGLGWKALFWLPARNANAFTAFIGPFFVGWRRPWLAGPARFEIERLDRIAAINHEDASGLTHEIHLHP